MGEFMTAPCLPRSTRHATLGAIAIVLACSTPAVAAAACADQSFGVGKVNVCTREPCRSFTPPEEIARISRGVYAEFIGLFINDGIASWLGADIDNAELIEVRRFAGRRLGSAPQGSANGEEGYVRETKTDRVHWIEVVRRRRITQEEVAELICAANLLWSAGRIASRQRTDVHNALFLVDGDSTKSFGGPGELDGEARAMRERLRALRDPTWGD